MKRAIRNEVGGDVSGGFVYILQGLFLSVSAISFIIMGVSGFEFPAIVGTTIVGVFAICYLGLRSH